jgi:hypothetical protein
MAKLPFSTESKLSDLEWLLEFSMFGWKRKLERVDPLPVADGK